MELRNVECSVLLCEFTSFLIFLLVSSSYFSLYLLFFSFVQQELVVYHHAFSVGSCSKKTSQPTSVIRPSLVLSFLFLSVLVLGAEDIQKKWTGFNNFAWVAFTLDLVPLIWRTSVSVDELALFFSFSFTSTPALMIACVHACV